MDGAGVPISPRLREVRHWIRVGMAKGRGRNDRTISGAGCQASDGDGDVASETPIETVTAPRVRDKLSPPSPPRLPQPPSTPLLCPLSSSPRAVHTARPFRSLRRPLPSSLTLACSLPCSHLAHVQDLPRPSSTPPAMAAPIARRKLYLLLLRGDSMR